MHHPSFHLRRWDAPFGGVEVDLAPLGSSKRARSDEQQRRQPHRTFRDEAAFIYVDVAKQLPDFAWIGQRGAVLRLPRRQGAAQVASWIALRAACRYGIPKYLSAVLMDAVGRLDGATLFNTLEQR